MTTTDHAPVPAAGPQPGALQAAGPASRGSGPGARTDLQVIALRTTILDVPLRRPHRFATTISRVQPLLLIEVITAGGVVGYGEGAVPGGPWWGGESVETMKVIVDRYLAPIVVGRRVDDIAGIMRDAERMVHGARFAKSGVDIALHDAYARTLDVGVHTLIGGAFRTSIDVTWALGSAPVAEIVDEISERLEQRLNATFKLKMGALEPAADTNRVLQIAHAVGGQAGLRIDVNARWDRFTALRHVPVLADGGIELIEQPTPGEQVQVLAELNALPGVSVMADESVHTPHDALLVAQQRAADVVAVKISKCGGLQRSKQVATVVTAAGLRCHAGTSIDGPIGTAAGIHFACSEPGIDFGSELFGPQLFAVELLQEPLVYRDGQVLLPQGPGLGIKLDPDVVQHLARD